MMSKGKFFINISYIRLRKFKNLKKYLILRIGYTLYLLRIKRVLKKHIIIILLYK
jgi:hypothetical protein